MAGARPTAVIHLDLSLSHITIEAGHWTQGDDRDRSV